MIAFTPKLGSMLHTLDIYEKCAKPERLTH